MICTTRPIIRVSAYATHTRVRTLEWYTVEHATLHAYSYQATMLHDGLQLHVDAGSVVLMPEGQTTGYQFPETPCLHAYVHFTPGIDWNIAKPLVLHDASDTFKRTWELPALAADNRLRAEIRLWDILEDICSTCMPPFGSSTETKERELVDQARIHILENLHSKLSLSTTACHCHISPNRLNILFNKHAGMTVQAYILQTRMELARDLLCHTDIPVKHVAWECGCPDLHYFNKLVRAAWGKAPRTLRIALKSEQNASPIP